jgi:hypothetical protein
MQRSLNSWALDLLIPRFEIAAERIAHETKSPGQVARPTALPHCVGPVPSPGGSRIFLGAQEV